MTPKHISFTICVFLCCAHFNLTWIQQAQWTVFFLLLSFLFTWLLYTVCERARTHAFVYICLCVFEFIFVREYACISNDFNGKFLIYVQHYIYHCKHAVYRFLYGKYMYVCSVFFFIFNSICLCYYESHNLLVLWTWCCCVFFFRSFKTEYNISQMRNEKNIGRAIIIFFAKIGKKIHEIIPLKWKKLCKIIPNVESNVVKFKFSYINLGLFASVFW